MMERVAELLRAQQAKTAEYSAAWMVAEQLLDLCREEPSCTPILAQDLENDAMSIVEAEKKIRAFADAHKKGSSSCVPPKEADRILREFYGLPKRGETAAAPGGIQTDYLSLLR